MLKKISIFVVMETFNLLLKYAYLHLDFETYGPEDIKKVGGYKYTEKARPLWLSYAFDDEPVQLIDLTNNNLPEILRMALTMQSIKKKAWNAVFEMLIFSNFYKIPTPPEQWECTMVKAAMLRLPLGLDECAKVLQIEQQKDKAGEALIRYFSKPCKPTKANGGRTFNSPHHDLKKWEAFGQYCKQDTEVERAIDKALEFFTFPPSEAALWCHDFNINKRGVMLDKEFAQRCIELDTQYKEKLVSQAINLTGIKNPGSVQQIKEWLLEETGVEVKSLAKDKLEPLMKELGTDKAKELIKIRQGLAKTSVKKYDKMLASVCKDGRLKGMVQFYGAGTGRWAGRIVQTHNLPRGNFKDPAGPRKVVMESDMEVVEFLYGPVSDTLSSLIRTAFIGEKDPLNISDYAAIEARVIAAVSGEQWRLDVFNSHGKIYEASAAQMFGVDIKTIGKDSPLRQKGKVAELALGYQGGKNALLRMGALEMGLEEDELQGLVDAWRSANPMIVRLWKESNKAALKAMEGEKAFIQGIPFKISFHLENGYLFCTLPSKRKLSYPQAGTEEGMYGNVVTYYGINQTTKKWEKQYLYGGLLVENFVQAIARDCLACGIKNAEKQHLNVVMHVHDEIVTEGKMQNIETLNTLLCDLPEWAAGLPLKAEGFSNQFYKK